MCSSESDRPTISEIKQQFYSDFSFEQLRSFTIKAPDSRHKRIEEKNQSEAAALKPATSSVKEYFVLERKMFK